MQMMPGRTQTVLSHHRLAGLSLALREGDHTIGGGGLLTRRHGTLDICIYKQICMHHMSTCTHIVHVCTGTHMCAFLHAGIAVDVHVHVNICACVYTYMHMYSYMYMFRCMYMYTWMYLHVYM